MGTVNGNWLTGALKQSLITLLKQLKTRYSHA